MLSRRKVDDEPPVMKPAAEFIDSLPDIVLQLTAWKALEVICQAYQGVYNVPSWSKPALHPEDFISFRHHFNAVLDVLRESKATCKNLFDTQITWFHRIAMQPLAEIKKKRTTTNSNTTRQHQYTDIERKSQAAGLPRVSAP